MSKTAAILQSGCILNRPWQPFEAHIPYLLQFKVDMNLSGMGWLHLEHARFRAPLHDDCQLSGEDRSPLTLGYEQPSSGPKWNVHTIPADWQWAATGSRQYVIDHIDNARCAPITLHHRPPHRQSMCELELDTSAEHIKNRRDVRWVVVYDALCACQVGYIIGIMMGQTWSVQLVRMPLLGAPPDARLVESLVPVWEEETRACAAQGCSLPHAPTSPPRQSSALCPAVDAVRAQLRAVVAAQRGAEAYTPVPVGHGTQGSTPQGATQGPAMASPHARLLQASPAANNVAHTHMLEPALLATNANQPSATRVPDARDASAVALADGAMQHAAWQAQQEGVLASQTADEALLHASQATDDDGLLHVLAQAAASQPQGPMSRC